MHSRFFDVRQSGIQGKGAFATRRIRKGQRIIEYAGERISNDVADSRYDETNMRRHHTFLFTVTPRKVVDGAVNGNESIYINHSCDPNCEAVIEDSRIFIEAVRTIQPGEELAYDYQYERTGEDDEEMAKFYKCLCGAPNCRGSIMKDKPKPRGKKNAGKRRSKR
ncbi:MAG: SET domain-containing protein-lysine N-methyltransferase [Gemmatimonadaceae bacterium]